MRGSEKQRIESIIKAANRAEDKLHLAKKLIDDAVSLIETAFLLHDETLYNEVKKIKRKEKEGKQVKWVEKDLDDGDEVD